MLTYPPVKTGSGAGYCTRRHEAVMITGGSSGNITYEYVHRTELIQTRIQCICMYFRGDYNFETVLVRLLVPKGIDACWNRTVSTRHGPQWTDWFPSRLLRWGTLHK